MPHTVTVASLSGLSTDGYGTETYTAGTGYKARIVGKQHVVRTFAGVEETATSKVTIASTSTFAPSSKFTMPDGSTPELLAIQAVPDEDGWHHQVASFV